MKKSLKEQLELASLACIKLKPKFNSCFSFHTFVSEDDFHLINSTGDWSTGCLIAPYYGQLNPGQIFSAENSATSRPASPTGVHHVGGSVSTVGTQVKGTDTLG